MFAGLRTCMRRMTIGGCISRDVGSVRSANADGKSPTQNPTIERALESKPMAASNDERKGKTNNWQDLINSNIPHRTCDNIFLIHISPSYVKMIVAIVVCT